MKYEQNDLLVKKNIDNYRISKENYMYKLAFTWNVFYIQKRQLSRAVDLFLQLIVGLKYLIANCASIILLMSKRKSNKLWISATRMCVNISQGAYK